MRRRPPGDCQQRSPTWPAHQPSHSCLCSYDRNPDESDCEYASLFSTSVHFSISLEDVALECKALMAAWPAILPTPPTIFDSPMKDLAGFLVNLDFQIRWECSAFPSRQIVQEYIEGISRAGLPIPISSCTRGSLNPNKIGYIVLLIQRLLYRTQPYVRMGRTTAVYV